MISKNAKFIEKDLGWLKIISEISKANNAYVKVGFQFGAVTKTQKKGTRTKKGGLSMPEIAAQNEYGTSKIPARPFMSSAVDMNRFTINDYISKQYNNILLGKSTSDRALGLIGQLMTRLIQKRIRQLVYPPNSPVTIALKGSSKPLIDFGQMVQSVRYVVVNP